ALLRSWVQWVIDLAVFGVGQKGPLHFSFASFRPSARCDGGRSYLGTNARSHKRESASDLLSASPRSSPPG
ncbi:hypothetical protein, partial [Mesorhizobium sp.]|uniref:hypothetical protein n=1 Tax=Mesorhizobium sp. TaxID=1871066 RepID=UPI00257C4B94